MSKIYRLTLDSGEQLVCRKENSDYIVITGAGYRRLDVFNNSIAKVEKGTVEFKPAPKKLDEGQTYGTDNGINRGIGVRSSQCNTIIFDTSSNYNTLTKEDARKLRDDLTEWLDD